MIATNANYMVYFEDGSLCSGADFDLFIATRENCRQFIVKYPRQLPWLVAPSMQREAALKRSEQRFEEFRGSLSACATLGERSDHELRALLISTAMRIAPLILCIAMTLGISSALAQQVQKQPIGATNPLGKLVDIGGYRLHLYCTGAGSPTVVLAAGAGDYSVDWALVQSRVGRFARVCSYDRAGEAWSDPGPSPRTMHQEAYEVHLVLDKAGEPGPYVLVGHSIGGPMVRIFAKMFPSDVGAVVLVDATSEDAILNIRGNLVRVRLTAKNRSIPTPQALTPSPPALATDEDRKQFDEFRKQFGAPKIGPPYDQLPKDVQQVDLWARSQPPRVRETDDYTAEEMENIYADSQKSPNLLGDKPLIVLIAGKRDQRPPNIAVEEWQRICDEKIEQKRRFALLSSNSRIIMDKNAGHHIQLDDPEAVVSAIQTTRAAAQQQRKLAP